MKTPAKFYLIFFFALLFYGCTEDPEEETVFDDISATTEITAEGGVIQVSDESGNIVKVTIPPGAVLDSASVALTLIGEKKEYPINERQIRAFKIEPADIILYKPVIISVQYNYPVTDIEESALFRAHSESLLVPLGEQVYASDNKSITATTHAFGDFAEGKMTLEEINSQIDLLASSLGISWSSETKSAVYLNQALSGGQIHKAIWEDWMGSAIGFMKFFQMRLLLGYYNNLKEGQRTLEEDIKLICKNILREGVKEVLKQGLPEDPCDKDYTYTIVKMMADMQWFGCEANTEYTQLSEAFNQMLLNCKTFLTLQSELNIESGGLTVSTLGFVFLTVSGDSAGMATIEGSNTLDVTGGSNAGESCVATVSGVTLLEVSGTRDPGFTYVLNLKTEQNAMLTTVCPKITTHTPLVGSGTREVTLSKSNGYTVTQTEEVPEGVFTMTVTMDNPYTFLPDQ